MTSKIFRSTILVAAIVLLCSLGIVMGVLYNYFDALQIAQLKDELSIAAVGTEQEGSAFLQQLESDRYRLTWVAPDGSVLYDTHADAAAMENHADREEIEEAMHASAGSASRQSATLLERTIYEAKRLSDGSVLRISVSQSTLTALLLGMLYPMVLVVIVAIVLSAILAKRMSRKIIEPLNDLDLEHPLENDTYEELSTLLNRVDRQNRQIQSQLQRIRQKADEFEQIICHMREGLVLMGKDGTVLTMNPAAMQVFTATESAVGNAFLTVDRKADMRAAMEEALSKGHSAFHAERNGRQYQFALSRIESEGKNMGMVVLAFDVTEKFNAERSRREFSANVSHELKTPLQSIMGSAELLENGLVKPEDMPRFVSRIYREAARLLNLIEDIIRLSQLDEGAQLNAEETDLLLLAQEAAAALQNAAESKSVAVRVTGEPGKIVGVRRLLYEIIYNLCDNAIKYNTVGGRVDIHVADKTLTVSDTGIGIPDEHQDRVFERFYRVDKSHSKQSGGTGLGLSIVKHAVQYHNAKLSLQSTPGKGTVITVVFPED